MITLQSPAKVNLFLRVLSRRADGYHELASLFQAVDLCDTIHLSLAHQDQLTTTDPSLPVDRTNLIYRAADLFRDKTGLNFKFNAHLIKHIPSQAGLGGGSGNAATTLWGLNQLCKTEVPEETLGKWAAEIGSDISFFFSHGTAYCTGKGDSILNLPALKETVLWIIKPTFGIPTGTIFQRFDPAKTGNQNPDEVLRNFLDNKPSYFNDLEIPAFEIFPQMINLKNEILQSGFHTALMTGSGSAFFALGDGQPPASSQTFTAKVNFINRTKGSWYRIE